MDLAVRHNSVVNEHVFCAARAEPAPWALASTALDESPHFSGRFGLLDPASVPPRAIELPMNCSLGISNLVNFCSLDHVVDFSPW